MYVLVHTSEHTEASNSFSKTQLNNYPSFLTEIGGVPPNAVASI